MVWINDHSFSHGACQCRGRVRSRLGRSTQFGFYECTNIEWSGNRASPALLVAPYDEPSAFQARLAQAEAAVARAAAALKDGIAPLVKVGARTLRRNGG
jgi:hypothetical protein